MRLSADDGHRRVDEMLHRRHSVAGTDVGHRGSRRVDVDRYVYAGVTSFFSISARASRGSGSRSRFAARVAHAVPWILGARSSSQATCPLSGPAPAPPSGATLSGRRTRSFLDLR